MRTSLIELVLTSLSSERLDDFRTLLGSDDFGGCFCAVWSSHDATWTQRCHDPSQPNYALTSARVRAGHHVGFLVYEGEQLVGWTGSGPTSDFPRMATRLASRLVHDPEHAWSVGCLALTASSRGRGMPARVVQALAVHARTAGARWLDAYPTRPWDEPRSYRGSERMYRALGFVEEGSERDDKSDIVWMRLALAQTDKESS